MWMNVPVFLTASNYRLSIYGHPWIALAGIVAAWDG
jgi:hypothetical protein